MAKHKGPIFINLQCPTCGANLQVAGAKNQFTCDHCGNRYLFDRKVEDFDATERERIIPNVTYTQHIEQWLRVAEYELFLHHISVETVKEQQVLYIDVSYRNQLIAPLTCRHDQWIVFDRDGYTYEPVKDYNSPELYDGNSKRYMGLSRTLSPGMRLRGWLAFLVPASTTIEYLQFSGGIPAKTVEFELKPLMDR